MQPDMTEPLSYRFSVAPMMDWTDRHCRVFHRCLSRYALLFSEMVTADAIIHGNRDRLLGHEQDGPVVLQLGGSDPQKLAEAVRIADDYNYDEFNLNCGCPSDRVQSGSFGACLMAEPELVADCVAAMNSVTQKPVTVKCRIAIDEMPERETLFDFVEKASDKGCAIFTVHARKAWLKGLSPKENREVPPLNYALVADLKAARPDLTIILNGGIETIAACKAHLEVFDGVMLGRAAYQSPAILADVDTALFGDDRHVTPVCALEAYKPYLAARLEEGVPLHSMTRHILGLFNGLPGARGWRRVLSEKGPKAGAGLEVVDEALERVKFSTSAAVT